MNEAEDGSEPPAALADGSEDCQVDEGKGQANDEVQGVAECLGPDAIAGECGSQQKGKIDTGQSERACRLQQGGQDQDADEASCKSSPDGHRASACSIATAALINAR